MTFCTPGVKANVTYQFNNQAVKTFKSENSPITVDTSERYTPVLPGAQCPIFYNVVYRAKFGASDTERIATARLKGAIYDAFMLGDFPEDAGYTGYNFDRTSGSFSANMRIYHDVGFSSMGGTAGGFFNQPGFIPFRKDYYIYLISATPDPINQPDNCGTGKEICTIKVLRNNQVIFTERGQCPINYSVTCGEECPPGTTKCRKSDYPGYCCLPCAATKAEIKAITSQVRSIANG